MNRSVSSFFLVLILFSGALIAAPDSAHSAVDRVEVQNRSIVADGASFGLVGPYVRLSGRLHYSVDPTSEFNASIHDLDLAPKDGRGRVTFSGDFVLLMPLNPERGNGRLIYDVTNRGNMVALGRFNDSQGRTAAQSSADMGNGFLMEQGYSVLWTGWNWDVVPGTQTLTIDLPIATQEDGRSIFGTVVGEIAPTRPTTTAKHVGMGAIGYPPAQWDSGRARLSVRDAGDNKYEPVPRESWRFGRPIETKSPAPALRDPSWITLDAGFEPGRVYRLTYAARNPPIVGLGLAALRDALSFFRYENRDSIGTENPLTAQGGALPSAALAYGHSQSGRALNTLIWEGLHVDERGRMVFDGVMIDGAGSGKGSFNFRFAQTSRHFSPDIELDFPTDFFPFSTVEQFDTITGERSSLLSEARRLNAVPRIFIVNTSTEYWARSASLMHTDTLGTTDVSPDPSVRLYVIAGGQHAVGTSDQRGSLVHCRSPLDHRPVLRALLSHLDAWVSLDRAPPASQYPRLSDGTLVSADTYRAGFPDVAFMRTPNAPLSPPSLDYGSQFAETGIAEKVPPTRGAPYETRVPASNEDGLDIAGVRLPDISVPLGAHTGWNPQNAETGAPNRLSRWFGSFIPFARTVTERNATGDPRPAITERYISKDDYVTAYAEATLELANQEMILGLDINPMIERASRLYEQILSHTPSDESCGFTSVQQ
ncbi:MAG: hypothetical protein HOH20_14400 [Rhodospirillaceae bacterium]|nr:hypothetical protein [Rhodospirillaceae bacterium]MBT6090760.1 hypothetical protein [Rhodospirillaceae bacterium]